MSNIFFGDFYNDIQLNFVFFISTTIEIIKSGQIENYGNKILEKNFSNYVEIFFRKKFRVVFFF